VCYSNKAGQKHVWRNNMHFFHMMSKIGGVICGVKTRVLLYNVNTICVCHLMKF
jgi:hypothetical protein